MKIVIITTDVPIYIPKTIVRILDGKHREHIQRVVLLPPTAKKRSWSVIAKEQARFGSLYFLIRSFQFLALKIGLSGIFQGVGFGNQLQKACSDAGIPLTRVHDINSDTAGRILGADRPDLLVSITASQIFRKGILSIPKWGTINIHNAPLPRYQGLMPSFWVLKNREPKTAVTVHFVDEGIDSGPILLQKPVHISPDETLHTLIKRTKAMAPEALEEVFDLFLKHEGNPPCTEMDSKQATYFGSPSRSDIGDFRRNGGKLIWPGIY